MQVIQLAEVTRRPRDVAVGMFDGVHLGHREVIRGSDTVLTFDPHPLAILHPEAAPKLLTTLEQKAELVEELGVEELVVIPFSEEFAARSAEDFIEHVLYEQLQARRVSVGENFRFGQRASGDPAMLTKDGRFEVAVAPLVEVDGETVSSSHIRGLLLAGEVDLASHFLGRPFELRGVVTHGDKRGRELGFPTANLVPEDQLVCPGHGVYAALANDLPAAVNVGVRPTFETGRGLLVEAYLIDTEIDLYDQELRIAFLQRLRGERAFSTAEALVAQMDEDVRQAREVATVQR